MGNSTIHITPIVRGELQMADIKRINVGGSNSFDLLYKHMNIKYPAFKTKLTQNYIQALMENLTYSANNYSDQLNYYRYGKAYFQNENYTNKIRYENNNIINENIDNYLREPVLVQFPSQNEEVVNFDRLMKRL